MAVDLDAIESYAKSGGDAELLAVVAELRAAREVIEIARIDRMQHTCGDPEYHTPGICDLCKTFAVYDKATKETSQ